jgi:transposase
MRTNTGAKGHTNKHAAGANQGGEASGQIKEAITAADRRRRWSEDEKARIVEESFKPGARVSEVANRHGVSRGMVFEWRRQAKAGAARQDAGRSSPAFVPVTITAPEEAGPHHIAVATAAIEIEMGAVRIRLNGCVDESALRTVLSALRAARC